MDRGGMQLLVRERLRKNSPFCILEREWSQTRIVRMRIEDQTRLDAFESRE
jgi:hypothetical protein